MCDPFLTSTGFWKLLPTGLHRPVTRVAPSRYSGVIGEVRDNSEVHGPGGAQLRGRITAVAGYECREGFSRVQPWTEVTHRTLRTTTDATRPPTPGEDGGSRVSVDSEDQSQGPTTGWGTGRPSVKRRGPRDSRGQDPFSRRAGRTTLDDRRRVDGSE